jgi:hypothetical protein
MRDGTTYIGLLAALRQQELLDEAQHRHRSTEVIRHRRGPGLVARIGRIFRSRA